MSATPRSFEDHACIGCLISTVHTLPDPPPPLSDEVEAGAEEESAEHQVLPDEYETPGMVAVGSGRARQPERHQSWQWWL